MTALIEIKIPDDLMESLPSDKTQMVAILGQHFDKVIAQYEHELGRGAGSFFGEPLSRFEKATLKDFLIRMTLGKKLAQLAKEETFAPL